MWILKPELLCPPRYIASDTLLARTISFDYTHIFSCFQVICILEEDKSHARAVSAIRSYVDPFLYIKWWKSNLVSKYLFNLSKFFFHDIGPWEMLSMCTSHPKIICVELNTWEPILETRYHPTECLCVVWPFQSLLKCGSRGGQGIWSDYFWFFDCLSLYRQTLQRSTNEILRGTVSNWLSDTSSKVSLFISPNLRVYLNRRRNRLRF